MFTSDRREEIKNLIMKNNRVDVSELSERFHVSEVTIRKDLIYLEKNGVLIRTHGGAVNIDSLTSETSPSESGSLPLSENCLAIARTTACLIDDNSFIYLGLGGLCTEIAHELKDKQELHVLTNNVSAAIQLAENPNISVILPPGTFYNRQGNYMVNGYDSLEFLSAKYVDKAILNADAAKYQRGFSVQDPDIANTYRTIQKNADETIIVLEGDSFSRNAFASFSDLSQVQKVVSDQKMPEDYISYFFEHSIQVFTSYDLENL